MFFQGSVWNLNIFKLRFLIQVLQIWSLISRKFLENIAYAEMKVWFVWECPEMLQLILLYQAQFKFKLNFTYFPTHITLSTIMCEHWKLCSMWISMTEGFWFTPCTEAGSWHWSPRTCEPGTRRLVSWMDPVSSTPTWSAIKSRIAIES